MRLTNVVALAVGLLPMAALPCGGFFCATAPVDQTGEQVVFAVGPSTIDVHVQISYVGSAETFSWVVPVEARPTLAVGTSALFSALDVVTRPRFDLRWKTARCPGPGGLGGFGGGAGGGPAVGGADAGSGVGVEFRGEVGPYDAAVLSASSAQALTDWLRQNGYVLTPQGEDALAGYVSGANYFVALKLRQDKGVGDLRPIVLKMERTRPCIPLRLTAIAARPNMPITAYVLAEHRGVPQNYRHVLVNEAAVDWVSGGQNYRAIASSAVDEAGGQAFLTEFAGRMAAVRPALWPLQQGRNWDLAALGAKAHPVDFVRALFDQGFPYDATLLGLLRRYVPMPAALRNYVPEGSFYFAIDRYRAVIDGDPQRAPFDPAGFVAELDEVVVTPMREAQALVGRFPYLTRLFTTMSPEEMTVDPELSFNPDLPEVSNVHTAWAEEVCHPTDPTRHRVRLTLSNGWVVERPTIGAPANTGPNAQRIEQLPESGPPVVLRDNSTLISGLLDPRSPAAPVGCQCGSAALGAPAAALALLLFHRRRRR